MDNLSDKIPNLSIKTIRGGNYEFKTIEGSFVLTSWYGFQSRQGPYSFLNKSSPSDGSVKIQIGGDAVSENPEVTKEQINAYNYLIDNQESIKNAILTSLLAEYKSLQELYEYDPESAASLMPNVDHIRQFTSLIGLSTVHLLNVSKNDIAYVGYEFGCSWDDEHGLGIMTHKNSVIKISDADTSFLTWVAEEDGKPESINQNEQTIIKSYEQQSKKPWWKFW